MNRSRKVRLRPRSAENSEDNPKAFVFYDLKTGARRFQVNAAADGSMPMDEAACLLAVHCVTRNQEPSDFGAMIAIGEDLIASVVGRARSMMENSVASASRVRLTERQQAILETITSGLSNKEIAAQLNLSLRTVKFHVSALLLKFEVSTRARLTRKLADLATPQPAEFPGNVTFPPPSVQGHGSLREQEQPRHKMPLMIPVQARLQGKSSRG